jgi:hypothetical protein
MKMCILLSTGALKDVGKNIHHFIPLSRRSFLKKHINIIFFFEFSLFFRHGGFLGCARVIFLKRDKLKMQLGILGLLALDQVLRKPWSGLTTFWTSTHWSRKECPHGAEIMDLTYFSGYVDPTSGFLWFF